MHPTQWSPERPLPPPVSLASQSHREKPPEVTCTSRGNPGFPTSTRESPRETFFNTSRGLSSHGSGAMTRSPSPLAWRPDFPHGDPTSLAPHERLTDLAIVPRERPHVPSSLCLSPVCINSLLKVSEQSKIHCPFKTLAFCSTIRA